ncbi:MAG: class I SAM-dependent methyltransferase [Marinosulfonomonas sp.]|nr:class I SAM-dependent methyltransferase [Marinosulfonomonas sp.]
MLRNDNEVFSIEDYTQLDKSHFQAQGNSWLRRVIPSASVNLSRNEILAQMKQRLAQIEHPVILVVGSGRQRTWLNASLTDDTNATILHSDIDVLADVDLFCDAHDLPFADQCIDAIVTTAVIEHVMYPERVASEIQRVLKPGGLLYSELPFIQQVHEGAYDFTRYTLSGHRRLFNGIQIIDSGMVAGPGTALLWTIENFFMAFFISRTARKIAKLTGRILFGWLKYFDYLLRNKPAAMDGASCTYIFGTRVTGYALDADIISGYVGAQHMSHT